MAVAKFARIVTQARLDTRDFVDRLDTRLDRAVISRQDVQSMG
jgi:hypothetical protein